jgi:hypothetical protein
MSAEAGAGAARSAAAIANAVSNFRFIVHLLLRFSSVG